MSRPVLSFQPLCRVPQLKPVVAAWLQAEWPAWYGAGGAGNLEGDVNDFAASEVELPVGILAFEDEAPVGFGALKKESISTHTHLAPWAAAGYVAPQRRGHGIGGALLKALVEHARGLAHSNVYCGTSTAVTLLSRAGWHEVEQVLYAGKPLIIFRSGA